VLLFALAYPRREFVSQPKYAAYLNLIEPWWKVLRSLALRGRRFESWEGVWGTVEEATAYGTPVSDTAATTSLADGAAGGEFKLCGCAMASNQDFLSHGLARGALKGWSR